MREPTVLIVPGLRDAVPEHWQTLLQAQLRAMGQRVHGIAPMGRDALDLAARVQAVDEAMRSIDGPVVLVGHSAGCITIAHWAATTRHQVCGALLAAPPDFDQPLPAGYPDGRALAAHGWLPVPRTRLPFRSIVAASHNDPLATYEQVAALAASWGSDVVDLGEVGHLNPASGFGPWPGALALIERLSIPPVTTDGSNPSTKDHHAPHHSLL